MVNLTIDGKQIQAAPGTTVLRAAQAAGIEIPTLCDHAHLTPFGGCRLCLVEVEGIRTLQPSCTLPVSEGMVVRTNTERIQSARRFVLTLIFSERNHFCPYCQVSGGDCELQNNALALGMTHWPLPPNWQPYAVDATHPYFVLDHNRCILCRRCVRACGELVGNFTLGFEERGTNSFLIADVGVPLGASSCISCGTCIQVCPTGALIERTSAYQGHLMEAERIQSVCLGCSLGCGIEAFVRDNRILRINGDWNSPVIGGVICKQGRFVPMEENRERITTPMIRRDGTLKPATWEEALAMIADQLKPLAGQNGNGIAALASTRLPAEALALFRHIFADELKAGVVTSIEEGRPTAAIGALAQEMGKPFEATLDALWQADCVVVIGTNLVKEHEVAGFIVKRLVAERASELVLINAEEDGLADRASLMLKPRGSYLDTIRELTLALKQGGMPHLQEAAALLSKAQKPFFIYGKALVSEGGVEAMKALILLARQAGGVVLGLKGQANSLAALQYGLDKAFEIKGQQAAYLALGDANPSQRLSQQLESVPFLAVQASHASKVTAMAQVVLPVEMWAEVEGHYVSMDGRLQKTTPVLKMSGQVRSNADALRALAEALGISDAVDWRAKLSERVSPVTIRES